VPADRFVDFKNILVFFKGFKIIKAEKNVVPSTKGRQALESGQRSRSNACRRSLKSELESRCKRFAAIDAVYRGDTDTQHPDKLKDAKSLEKTDRGKMRGNKSLQTYAPPNAVERSIAT